MHIGLLCNLNYPISCLVSTKNNTKVLLYHYYSSAYPVGFRLLSLQPDIL